MKTAKTEKRCLWCGKWFWSVKTTYCRPQCRREHEERKARDAAKAKEPLAILKKALADLVGDDGFVCARDMCDQMQRAGVFNPDREIAKLMETGKVVLQQWDYGQMRHGEGLFGDPSKQLVKLLVF